MAPQLGHSTSKPPPVAVVSERRRRPSGLPELGSRVDRNRELNGYSKSAASSASSERSPFVNCTWAAIACPRMRFEQ